MAENYLIVGMLVMKLDQKCGKCESHHVYRDKALYDGKMNFLCNTGQDVSKDCMIHEVEDPMHYIKRIRLLEEEVDNKILRRYGIWSLTNYNLISRIYNNEKCFSYYLLK